MKKLWWFLVIGWVVIVIAGCGNTGPDKVPYMVNLVGSTCHKAHVIMWPITKYVETNPHAAAQDSLLVGDSLALWVPPGDYVFVAEFEMNAFDGRTHNMSDLVTAPGSQTLTCENQ